MKVYGGCYFRNGTQVRGIIAGTRKIAAQKTGSSLAYILEYWTETGNAIELKLALEHPGVLFWCNNSNYKRTLASYGMDKEQD